jgi:PIN domain nuclease of toxin-antitoxin system
MPLYLDTHVLVWLNQDGAARLTPSGAQAIETTERPLISPMAELELTYLHKISRINCSAAKIVDTLRRDLDREACKLPFASVVGAAIAQTRTRNPFDRPIIEQAAHGQSPLLSADRNFLALYSAAFW